MDTKQLIASLVSSLAWPVAVACIAFIFRGQLKTSKVEANLGEAPQVGVTG